MRYNATMVSGERLRDGFIGSRGCSLWEGGLGILQHWMRSLLGFMV